MDKLLEKIKTETKDLIFHELKEMFDYWGEKNFVSMLDFCHRNNLHAQKMMLINLMKNDRIKV